MKTFSVSYEDQSQQDASFAVRGICKCDVLNPCWDNRKTDILGRHWGGGLSCEPCTEAAKEAGLRWTARDDYQLGWMEDAVEAEKQELVAASK